VKAEIATAPDLPAPVRGIAALLLSCALAACGRDLRDLRAPDVPANTPIHSARWLDQNWSDDERFWFHHTSQGTATIPIPFDWFVALEQPTLRLFGDPPLMTDEDHLRRFGFIPSPREIGGEQARAYGYPGVRRAHVSQLPAAFGPLQQSENPFGLPVGFARLRGDLVPNGEDQLGFTCAACHTGQLEVNGVSIRIDGAPAVVALPKFTKTLGLAIAYTWYVPGRFARFADRVLGPNHDRAADAELVRKFGGLLKRAQRIRELTQATAAGDVCEGPGRLDALTRIGNQIFFQGLFNFEREVPANADALANLRSLVAPVSFPPIWDTPWFQWVQYDASIGQPMVRNLGQALGVGAQIELAEPGPKLYETGASVAAIFELESLLAGPDPHRMPIGFKGLRAPRWPEDLLGPIDTARRADGERLYTDLCVKCHGSPVSSQAFWEHRWTKPNGAGERYLRTRSRAVGTDPARATLLVGRRVQLPAYLEVDVARLCGGTGGGVVTEAIFGAALASVVERAANRWYADHQIAESDRDRMNGHRPNCLRSGRGYKPRPLDGIWATAPFLHNGSVPTLFELFSPRSERSERFYVGSRRFDPVRVGYESVEQKGAFLFDTKLPGNSNAGHEFRDEPGPERVERALSKEERMSLIEFLKSPEPNPTDPSRTAQSQ
jgi:mono/diheme cytochrome c family protein